MAEILPNLPSDQRAGALDIERRWETGAPGAEGAFAELLRMTGSQQQSAGDLLPDNGEAASEPADPALKRLQTDLSAKHASGDLEQPMLPRPQDGGGAFGVTAYGPLKFTEQAPEALARLPTGSDRLPLPDPVEAFQANDLVGRALSPASRDAPAPASSGWANSQGAHLLDTVSHGTLGADSKPAAPTGASRTLDEFGLESGRPSAMALADAHSQQMARFAPEPTHVIELPHAVPQNAALEGAVEAPGEATKDYVDARRQAPPHGTPTASSPAKLPSETSAVQQALSRTIPARQEVRAETSPRSGVSGELEKARSLLLEQARRQAQTTAVHVAVVAVEDGIRVVARAGILPETDRTKLKHSITALLAEHGFADASVFLDATPNRPGKVSERG